MNTDPPEGDTQSLDRSPVEEPVPQNIGPYKILEVLGEGGMGVVYHAEQTKPIRRRVALKVVKPGMDSKAVIARFESERQALALMDHPGVAKVFDAGTTDKGRPYFVMERVAGIPITEHCDRHKLDIEARLKLFMDVCEAVHHAHQKGIIHRDIKPSNILVAFKDGKSVAKVIDFGVAKATQQRLTEATLFTAQGQIIGTPAYMSPEQAEMTAQDVDTRSDIYSLGVVLYQLLTGALPFDPKSLLGAAFEEIRRIIREEEPPKPSTRVGSAVRTDASKSATDGPRGGPYESGDDDADSTTIARNRHTSPEVLTRRLRGDLDWVTMKALEKDRSRRYASATDLAADLRRHLSHEPVVAGPPGTAYRVKKFVRRNRGVVTGVAAIFVVLVGGIATTTSEAVRATRAEQLAGRRLEEARQAVGRAEAVNHFLQDMLGAVSPWKREHREVSVREVLDEAAKKVADGSLEDQPGIEAEIGCTIAETYMALGLHDQAESHVRAALSTLRRTHGDTELAVAHVQVLLGRVLQRKGDHLAAVPMFNSGLSTYRRVLQSDDKRVAGALHELAFSIAIMGNLQRAERLFHEVIAMKRRLFGDESASLAQTLHALAAMVYEGQGRLDEAERLCREALAMKRNINPGGHVNIAECMSDLARMLRKQGKYDEAEPLARQGLAMNRRLLGNEHPFVADSAESLADLLCSKRLYYDAEPLYRESLAIRRKLLGDDNPYTLRSIYDMGCLMRDLGRLEEAEALGAEAVQRARDALPEGHYWITGVFLGGYGKTLLELKRFPEAEETLLEAHGILETSRGAKHERTIKVIKALIDLYDAWHAADPDKGYDVKAAEYRAMLREGTP